MKSLFVCLALFGLIISHLACGQNISPTSSNSSSGAVTGTPTVSSTPTPGTQFQATYQNSEYPNTSYTGETDAWINASNPSNVMGSSPYLEVLTEKNPIVSASGYARTFVKFTGISLPSNTTVLGAEVDLTTETATNIPAGNSVTIGVHTFSISVYNPSNLGSSCMPAWTLGNLTWGEVNGSLWTSCDGSGSSFTDTAYFNSIPNSTYFFSSSNNGNKTIIRWFLNTADIQSEILSGTIQFVLRSEGEFTSDTSTALVGFYPNTDTSGNAPKLLISYQ